MRSRFRSLAGAPSAAPVNPTPAPIPAPPQAPIDLIAELLIKQMLSLLEIATTQDRQIQALKARWERQEQRERAGMVAFTAFFHILEANKVSNLTAMADVFANLIDQAQLLDLPEDSILYLRSIQTMLLDNHSKEDNASQAL